MMNADNIIEKAALEWRNNHGVGTALVPAPLNYNILLYKVLTRVYNKNPVTTTVIIVESLAHRSNVIEFLTNQESDENNNEFKKLVNNKLIKVLTKAFVTSTNWYAPVTLCILYNPDSYDTKIASYFDNCHYRLAILTKLLCKENNTGNLYKKNPILDCFKQTEIDELRVSSPIEEMWVDVTIPEESEQWKLYQYYSKYIETSINIFGSFDIMKQCRLGDEKLNISSAAICAQIAQENGWSDRLDMSFEFNQKIDELYNPNALRERASNTYEIIRNRNNIVSDYEGKLEKILELVKEKAGHKILIISKRGEFATQITNYLNEHFDCDICGNYHNKMDDIPAVDINGNPVYFKSGIEKGKRKSMGYKAQMTLNEKLFNLGKIYCLSMSNAPDKSLTVEFDTVIITSPLCEDIKSYLYRLSNIRLISDKIILFSLFCSRTIEQQKLFNKPVTEMQTIINKDKIIISAENNADFICVD